MIIIRKSQIDIMDDHQVSQFADKLIKYFKRNDFVVFDFEESTYVKYFKKLIYECRSHNIISEINILDFIILKYHKKVFQNENIKERAFDILNAEHLSGEDKINLLKKII